MHKIGQSGRFLDILLGSLLKNRLSLTGNVLNHQLKSFKCH